MPRTLSLNFRTAANAQETEEVPIVLVSIQHASLEAPIRLSSDPTRRLGDDPLRYGTVADGLEYDFVLMTASLPDDREGAPGAVSLSFENVVADMAAIVRAVTSPAQVDMRWVLAAAPDSPEQVYSGLSAVKASYDASRVTIDVSREAIVNEPWPAHRMTQRRFPGLYR
jgi:hypothetical protein